ncbi:MAG TPA: S26 family signal peptidase [Candidatus Micrarchaeia archaeon]|nr:S26 family signal peptidase [Candidatus Micrarchaeia archaeon]
MTSGTPAPIRGGRRGWGIGRVPAVALLTLAGWGGWRWRPSWVRVLGPSMAPLLPAGAWVVVSTPPRRGVRLGMVVVAVHPKRPELEVIKRVVARTRDGSAYWLGGDDPLHSTDSDEFGPVAAHHLRAVARLRLRPLPPTWLGADPNAIRRRGAPTGRADLRG